MPVSPHDNTDAVVAHRLLFAGEPLDDNAQCFEIEVRRAIGQLPSARIVLGDGNMPDGAWPLADGSSLLPGTEVEIQAGYGDVLNTLFKGVIVRWQVSVDGHNASRLVLDCRDKAVAMSLQRHNAIHIDQTDSAVMHSLIGQHPGLTADIQSTSVTYRELVQYYASDWDFLLARAEANGLLVVVQDGTVQAKPPRTSGVAALRVTWGQDLYALQAELDPRWQSAQVTATAWDPKNQAVQEGATAEPEALSGQGNLDGKKVAGLLTGNATRRLLTSATADSEALKAWGAAEQLKSALARLRGHVRFQGSEKALVGGLLELAGAGERFSGPLLISRVEHRIADGGWMTEAGFGLDPQWHCARTDVMAPPNGGRLPGVGGLQVGVVLKLDADPASEHRIQIKLPMLDASTNTLWARLLQSHASNGFGAFFLPEVGDEVLVGFFDQDPSCPVVLGSLYSSKHKPPYELAASNDTKAWVTRAKHKLVFNEADKIISITTPGGNHIELDDKAKCILAEDQHGNQVKLDSSGILLSAIKDVVIKAAGDIKATANGNISLAATMDLTGSGMNVTCEAQVGFTGKGNATAELSAAGQTTVKGALVMIN